MMSESVLGKMETLQLLVWERPIGHWVQKGPLLILGCKVGVHYQEWSGGDETGALRQIA